MSARKFTRVVAAIFDPETGEMEVLGADERLDRLDALAGAIRESLPSTEMAAAFDELLAAVRERDELRAAAQWVVDAHRRRDDDARDIAIGELRAALHSKDGAS